ncbi:Nif11-like leader peptide family RiPP precursor, partial [Selenomonas sp. KH1T6]
KKAMACQSVEELLELAKDEGYDMTKEEAEKYFAQLSEIDLSPEDLKQVAGGTFPPDPTSLKVRRDRSW